MAEYPDLSMYNYKQLLKLQKILNKTINNYNREDDIKKYLQQNKIYLSHNKCEFDKYVTKSLYIGYTVRFKYTQIYTLYMKK